MIEGPLQKLRQSHRPGALLGWNSWRNRFFALQGPFLCYFSFSRVPQKGEQPKWQTPLSAISAIALVDATTFTFQASGRVFFLRSSSVVDASSAAQWVRLLQGHSEHRKRLESDAYSSRAADRRKTEPQVAVALHPVTVSGAREAAATAAHTSTTMAGVSLNTFRSVQVEPLLRELSAVPCTLDTDRGFEGDEDVTVTQHAVPVSRAASHSLFKLHATRLEAPKNATESHVDLTEAIVRHDLRVHGANASVSALEILR